MSTELLGYIFLAGWLVVNGVALASDFNPWKDRPLSYCIFGAIIEVAAVWLAIRAVL